MNWFWNILKIYYRATANFCITVSPPQWRAHETHFCSPKRPSFSGIFLRSWMDIETQCRTMNIKEHQRDAMSRTWNWIKEWRNPLERVEHIKFMWKYFNFYELILERGVFIVFLSFCIAPCCSVLLGEPRWSRQKKIRFFSASVSKNECRVLVIIVGGPLTK